MVTRPAVHQPSTTIAQLRAFFADDHIHVALLVDHGKLVGTVERCDLADGIDDRARADAIAQLDGRTISPTTPVTDALTCCRRTGRRRLAVTSEDGALLGLLCLKASGSGFCSDADVDARRAGTAPASRRPNALLFQ